MAVSAWVPPPVLIFPLWLTLLALPIAVVVAVLRDDSPSWNIVRGLSIIVLVAALGTVALRLVAPAVFGAVETIALVWTITMCAALLVNLVFDILRSR
jgi:hypothetical protein